MDQCDIKYLVELLDDAINSRDWDTVEEAKYFAIEFLDDYIESSEE